MNETNEKEVRVSSQFVCPVDPAEASQCDSCQ